MQENTSAQGNLTPKQQAMVDLWEQHLRDEFELRSVDATMATMVAEPHNLNVPVVTGGDGGEGVREYYSRWFIPQNPPDSEITLISRTIGEDRLVDELVQIFTHSIEMDWMLPGIPPTGKRVEIPVVVIVEFRDGKIASEHIHWDQASVLAQIGLLDTSKFPVVGAECAQRLLNPSLPLNGLIEHAHHGT